MSFQSEYLQYIFAENLKMLFHNAIPHIIEKRDDKGNPVVFDCLFVKKSTGEVVNATKVQCISSHFRPRTYNLKFPGSGEIRKVRHCSIIEVNGEKISR